MSIDAQGILKSVLGVKEKINKCFGLEICSDTMVLNARYCEIVHVQVIVHTLHNF